MDPRRGIRADGLGHPCFFCRRRRYYIALMACLGYVASYSTRVNLSIAILYMTEPYNVTVKDSSGNETVIEKKDYDWDEEIQGVILSSFFYGYAFTQLPGGYLAGVIGGNHVLNIGVLGSGIVSLLGPVFMKLNFTAAIVMRVICGVFQGVTVPAVSCIWARWAPPLERTILSTIAISGNFFSSIIIMPICSAVGDHIGWEYSFYIFGLSSVLWSLIWGLTVAAGPEKDRFIKESELEYIQTAIGERTDQKPIHPWKRIFSSLPVGACVVSQTGHNWGYYTVLLLGPKYYHETLLYSVRLSAIFTGISFTICGFLMQIFGHLQDLLRRRGMKTVLVRKIFCIGGFAIQFTFMVTLAFLRIREYCVVISILTIGFGGITWSAFNVNPLDIAAPHAAIISGIANTCATISGILCPMVATELLKDSHTIHDWMWIWIICAAIYAFSALFFLLFAKGEKQSWVYTI